MKFKCLAAAAAVSIACMATSPAIAQDKPAAAAKGKQCKKGTDKPFVVVNEDLGVPVFPHDLTDRPYKVVGEIKAGIRKATIFSKEASQEKIYCELWERAVKLGADAVINAKYGDSHVSAMSWGKTNATGTAIKFDSAEAPATN